MAMDTFAQIAHGGIKGRLEELMFPAPPAITQRDIPLAPDGAFAPPELPPHLRLNTPETLRAALDELRAQYEPFLACVAPTAPATRTVRPLQSFTWRQKGEDVLPETVTLPHYGGPLGAAVCWYDTVFSLDTQTFASVSAQTTAETFAPKSANAAQGKRLFLVITAADYKARVFVNGAFAGAHEGFFAAFELDVTELVHSGENALRIEVENDYVMLGNTSEQSSEKLFGDKLYAATGPGYDDPARGWHHCPPGMGLFDKVYLEWRDTLAVTDLFTRTLDESVEVWAEITSCAHAQTKVFLSVSLYGENHVQTVFERRVIEPSTGKEIGLGDTFTEVLARRENTLNVDLPLLCAKGRNVFKFTLPRAGLKTWQTEAPYLYQLQVSVLDADKQVRDTLCRAFGVRTFTQDVQSKPKGMFYLNGESIRLRGANTMGFEQQDVMRGDTHQLIDDMLLAKLCNMNFLRLTQRPVQREVYDICDRVGLMTQTDLPLFGCLRRHMFCEAVRQAEEMERHVRRHACNIMVTYINEPFPNAHNQPNMNLTRPELEQFFAAADIVVKLNNPDRVIKHVDGDYDPPSALMPDNHCYPMWYNGHGIDIGRLHKGGWMQVKPGWYYGCGEFGCEGLEDEATMRAGYPEDWLPQTPQEDAAWSPASIVNAQTAAFHHFFYETQHTLADWIRESQRFQAYATRLMTEAFRRDARMVSFAIHLFIDAFPSGWMKTIMDCERRPKPAFFAYRDALAPVLLSLRTDKFAYSVGDTLSVEGWLCNDTHTTDACRVEWQLLCGGKPFARAQSEAALPELGTAYCGSPSMVLPQTQARETLELHAYVLCGGKVIAHNSLALALYPAAELPAMDAPIAQGETALPMMGQEANAPGTNALGVTTQPCTAPQADEQSVQQSARQDDEPSAPQSALQTIPAILPRTVQSVTAADIAAAERGAILWIDAPEEGTHCVADSEITVTISGMAPMHFAARDTGHVWVEGCTPYDFSHWYDSEADSITPLAECTFTSTGARADKAASALEKASAPKKASASSLAASADEKAGVRPAAREDASANAKETAVPVEKASANAPACFTPVLTSRNLDATGAWQTAMLLGEKPLGKGHIVVSQIPLRRFCENPAGRALLARMTAKD